PYDRHERRHAGSPIARAPGRIADALRRRMARRGGRDRSSALDPGRARLSGRKFFAQLEALDLAGCGLRQRIDEFDPTRIFPWADRALDVGLEALIERPAGALAGVAFENHEGHRLDQTFGV